MNKAKTFKPLIVALFFCHNSPFLRGYDDPAADDGGLHDVTAALFQYQPGSSAPY